VARVQSILGNVKGMARDFSVDQMPKGYVWDLTDYIPDQRGAQLEGRGPWNFLTSAALAGPVWGGYDAVYTKGERLLIAAGPNLYDQPRLSAPQGQAAANLIGPLFSSIPHNGRFLNERTYFSDSQGASTPKYVTFDGANLSIQQLSGANTPKAKYIEAFKGRLIGGGDPANPQRIYFSPVETDGGPPGAWDNTSIWDTSRAVTALGVMAAQIVVFHDGMTERLKGSIPPGQGIDTKVVDFSLDLFSNQYGCIDPASIVPWRENLIFANEHGVHLTDGSTIRSLTDQGGIGDVWRHLYGLKRTGTQVSCGVYLNMLFCSILTYWDSATERENRPFTFVCDLDTRNWYRFSNVAAGALIPSTTGAEQLWWGTASYDQPDTSYANRLCRISPMLTGLPDINPENPASLPDAVDGNGVAVLPRVTTGWTSISAEGQKRMRSLYVSHAIQSGNPPAGNLMRVSYRLTPVVIDDFLDIGGFGSSNRYTRKRLPVGRNGYGIQVHLEQIAPSHISRLYDIGVEQTKQDQSKVG
jgi:hypothetical protein